MDEMKVSIFAAFVFYVALGEIFGWLVWWALGGELSIVRFLTVGGIAGFIKFLEALTRE